MQTVKVPLFGEIYRNVDETVSNDLNWRLVNAYRDDAGGINSRPGLTYIDSFHTSAGSPVNGIYWWEKRGLAFINAGNKLQSLSYSGSSYTKADLTSDVLQNTGITSFANDGTYLFAANGGRIVYTDGTSVTTYIADADAPTAVTHIAWLDGYLLALSGGTVYFSGVNTPLVWGALDFFTTPGSPDDTIAMRVKQREIYLFGTSSVEIWENDGETPFSRVPGGYLQVGCIAAASVVETENGMYWLDSNRRFSRFADRNPQIISSPFDKDIQSYSRVSDCVGYRIVIDGADFAIWNFPSENKTLVYNIRLNDWYEWGTWVPALGDYQRFVGQATAFAPAWGKNLVGAYDQPYVYEMSPEVFTDNGAVIRAARRSGHIDYKTSKQKRSEEFRMRLRRGDDTNSSSTPPQISIRWRNNNRPTWSAERPFSLGAPGSSDIIVRLHRTGIYRTRQYELAFSDAAKLVFCDAEEDIEILR